MKKYVVLLAALTLLGSAALVSAARPVAPQPVAQPGPALEGVRWVLVSHRGADGSATPALAGNPATAEFRAGRVAGSTGCNQYSAAYQQGNNTFSIGPGIATKMACAPALMAQEAAFLQHLEGVRGYWIQEGRLTLHDAQGAVVLTFQVQETVALTGSSWRMTMYNNGSGGFQSARTGVEVTATFDVEGRLTGNAGCNTYTAAYTLSGDQIKISPPVSTRMACEAPIMQQETAYLRALENAATYEVRGSQLTLRDARGAAMAGFELIGGPSSGSPATPPGGPAIPGVGTPSGSPATPPASSAAPVAPGAAVSPTLPISPTAPPVRPALVTIDLSAGFALDPTFLSVQGGGPLAAATLGPGCAGFVNAQPVVTVRYNGGADRVRAFFVSNADPTLVVQTPDGRLLCNDDATGRIQDPYIDLLNAPGGEYRIWVGSAAPNQLIPGILVLTTRAAVDLGTFDVSRFITRPLIPQVEAQSMALKAAPAVAARSLPGNLWRVDYYANGEWAGNPVMTEYPSGALLRYDWAYESPGPYIPRDNFTARLFTDVYFYGTTYTFTITADDEFVLMVDGATLFDTRGKGQSGQTFNLPVPMSEGYHRVEVMYREWTERAYLSVNWSAGGGGNLPPTVGGVPPLPPSAARVQTRYGDFTRCRQQGIHQASCFASDGAWDSPNVGSIQLEPQIQVWRACEPADGTLTFYISPQEPQRTYKCSKTLAGWFPQ